jgi:hypothetical protein
MSTNIPEPHGRPASSSPTPAASASGTGPAGTAPGTGPARPVTPSTRASSAPASRTGTAKDAPGTAGEAPAKTREGIGGSDWSMFRTVVVLVGLILAGFGAYYLILGTSGLPDTDAQPVNPTLESQFRFFSAMMVGVGAAFVTIAVKFQWANMLWLVCLMVFAGGIGRVLSWAFSGTPHYLLIILMVVELAFPAALLVWHKYITKTAQMRKDFSTRG